MEQRFYNLVYIHKGEIKIEKGFFDKYGNFRKSRNPRIYHTKLHRKPLTLNYGKVWCKDEDLWKAIQIVKDNYLRYFKETTVRTLKLAEYIKKIEKE